MVSELETVVFQVTTKCPYNCPQCYMQRGHEEMSVEVAKSAMDEALRAGAKAVQLTGGEPLVYPHLPDVIGYASKIGLETLLATSGHGFTDEMCRTLKANGLRALCISVNGLSEDTNRKSRTPFAQALSAVQTAKDQNLLCFLNVVITDDNIQELELLGDYARKHGVAGLVILRPVPSHDGVYVPQLSVATIEMITRLVKRDPDFFHVEGCHRAYWSWVTAKPFSCRDIGKTTYFVNADGTVSPCSKLMKHRYGSVADMLDNISDWECGCL